MDADGCWRMGDGCWRMGDGCLDTTDLLCGETRCALRQRKMRGSGKTRALWWQGTMEAAFGRPHFVTPLFLPTTKVLSCHNQTSCAAAAHISSRQTTDPYPHACAPRPPPKMCGQRSPCPHACVPPPPPKIYNQRFLNKTWLRRGRNVCPHAAVEAPCGI